MQLGIHPSVLYYTDATQLYYDPPPKKRGLKKRKSKSGTYSNVLIATLIHIKKENEGFFFRWKKAY